MIWTSFFSPPPFMALLPMPPPTVMCMALWAWPLMGGYCQVVKIPVWLLRFPSNLRSIPYHSPDSVLTILWDSDTMLPFPQTLRDPWDLQHYIIAFPDPQTTSEIPDHISVSLFCFSPLTLHSHFHIPISVFIFLFLIHYTVSVLLLSHSSLHSTIVH